MNALREQRHDHKKVLVDSRAGTMMFQEGLFPIDVGEDSFCDCPRSACRGHEEVCEVGLHGDSTSDPAVLMELRQILDNDLRDPRFTTKTNQLFVMLFGPSN